MLLKLQKNTLVKPQIIGYTITLFFGVSILLTTIQLYLDAKPLLNQQSDIFKNQSAVISKNISVFKTIDKEKIYFTEKEIQDLKNQIFSKSISKFNTATFKISSYGNKSENIPAFYTDLFFESIPDEYLDVKPDEWHWDSSLDFIPIIMPENYLNLYNFGFAESQGLPVLSKNTISQIKFNIQISGNNKSKEYESKIVGFGNKINSILVPEDFLLWANEEFGRTNTSKTSRILIEFNNPSDVSILKYFNENNYSINKEELEFSKLIFFFKAALLFVFFIAIIIVVLSISFVLLSFNLLFQKNKELMLNLYNIGYNHRKIAKFYQVIISSVILISVISAMLTCNFIRKLYLQKFINLFDFTTKDGKVFILGIIIILVLLIIYNILLIRNIKRIVVPRR